jgi:hypothetical protein
MRRGQIGADGKRGNASQIRNALKKEARQRGRARHAYLRLLRACSKHGIGGVV